MMKRSAFFAFAFAALALSQSTSARAAGVLSLADGSATYTGTTANFSGPVVLASGGDFAQPFLTNATSTPAIAAVGSTITVTTAAGFTFTGTEVLFHTGPSGNTYDYEGTATYGAISDPTSLSIAVTNTGGSPTQTAGFQFNSPPVNFVPEPSSIVSALMGTVVVGGFLARRRVRKA